MTHPTAPRPNPSLPPGARPLARVIVYVTDSQPGVLSVDISVGEPVGDYTPEEVAATLHVTAEHLIEQLTDLWAMIRAESN